MAACYYGGVFVSVLLISVSVIAQEDREDYLDVSTIIVNVYLFI